MRLLFVSNHFPPAHVGGYELLCADTARAFRSRGHDVVVITTGSIEERDTWVQRLLRFDATLADPAAAAWNRSRLEETVREGFSAALVWNTYGLGHEAVFATLRAAVPTTCYLMLHDLAYYGPAGLRDLRLIACSQMVRFHFLLRGFSHEALPLIYPGVSLPGEARRHGGEEVRLLYCGRIISYKGLHVALLALRDLPPSFTLTAIGSPDRSTDYGEGLLPWVRGQGLQDRVSFRGGLSHSETLAEYARHDVLVFPSLWEEPLGLVVLEAMAAGLPVVASRRGAPTELLTHARTGLLVEPGDHHALAGALRTLVSARAREEMGAAARADAARRFAFDRFIDELEAELTGIAAR